MAGRYLILNADDFGMCPETNAAIIRLLQAGRLSSTTLMAPCPAAEEAAALAREHGFAVGMHITLTSDFPTMPWRSVAPREKVVSLLDSTGHFYHEPRDLYRSAVDEEVELEIRAQYQFIKAHGAAVDHVDSHVGTVYGLGGRPFLGQVYRLCAEEGLPFRLPKSDGYLKAVFGGRVPPEVAEAHRRAVAAAEERGVHLLTHMITSPHSVKELGGRQALKDFYLRAIRETGEGITELFMHPSLPNEEIARVFPEWQKRIWEMEILLDDELLKTLDEEEIQLVSWSTAPWGES